MNLVYVWVAQVLKGSQSFHCLIKMNLDKIVRRTIMFQVLTDAFVGKIRGEQRSVHMHADEKKF